MTDVIELLEEVVIGLVMGKIIGRKGFAECLLARVMEQGVSLVGLGGLLNQFTKNVLEIALNAELPEDRDAINLPIFAKASASFHSFFALTPTASRSNSMASAI